MQTTASQTAPQSSRRGAGLVDPSSSAKGAQERQGRGGGCGGGCGGGEPSLGDVISWGRPVARGAAADVAL